MPTPMVVSRRPSPSTSRRTSEGPDCRRLRDVELLLAKEKGGRQCDGQLLKSKSSKPKPELDASPVWRKLERRSQRRGR